VPNSDTPVLFKIDAFFEIFLFVPNEFMF
jgi:hypothetical protein